MIIIIIMSLWWGCKNAITVFPADHKRQQRGVVNEVNFRMLGLSLVNFTDREDTEGKSATVFGCLLLFFIYRISRHVTHSFPQKSPSVLYPDG